MTQKKLQSHQNPNIFYKIRANENLKPKSNLEIASTIADAFLGDSKAVPLAHKRMLSKI